MINDLKTEDALEYIKQLKKEGHSLNQVATKLKVGTGKVRYYLEKYHSTCWTDLPPQGSFKNESAELTINKKGGLSYIIQKKNQGYTQIQIANECGYKSVGPINTYLQKRGVYWRDIGKKKRAYNCRTKEEEWRLIEQINSLIEKKYTAGEIYDELNMAPYQVHYIFRKNKISFRPIKDYERDAKEKDFCKTKKRYIQTSKRTNKTGFYRVSLMKNGLYRYRVNDNESYYHEDIIELRNEVIDKGLDWVVVNPELADKTLNS